MKSVLISIQPQWCELIASGKKTIEVRRTRPNIETPFKVYIYQTKKHWIYKLLPWLKERQAKVIGEFICDYVRTFRAHKDGSFSWTLIPGKEEPGFSNAIEMLKYVRGKSIFYGWHISELKIYDEPKKLKDFVKPCDWNFDCSTCKRAVYELTKAEAKLFYACDREISRAPQSWQYVEEV